MPNRNLYHHNQRPAAERFTAASTATGWLCTEVSTGEKIRAGKADLFYCSDFCKCSGRAGEEQTP